MNANEKIIRAEINKIIEGNGQLLADQILATYNQWFNVNKVEDSKLPSDETKKRMEELARYLYTYLEEIEHDPETDQPDEFAVFGKPVEVVTEDTVRENERHLYCEEDMDCFDDMENDIKSGICGAYKKISNDYWFRWL